ncbi:hypothetical protein [Hyphomicrobium sp.]|uniref:hypothetical protein n=1 Tax=Hyphomicrobium sp. TaxID=82 RepID=UPI003F6F5D1B
MKDAKTPSQNPSNPRTIYDGPPRPAIVRSEGGTPSERYLAKLADKSFLNLWSYPNTFIDKKADGKGDGKELCDLLVVCGDDILIFSDKTVAWPGGDDEELAWKRWYKRAIAKSVDQIRGAERWIRNFPDRIYLDRVCSKPLPFPLPPPERRRIHGIVVALGAGQACRKHFGGGTGSLAVRPELKGDAHWNGESVTPFVVGDVNPEGSYVHVLDDATLDIVLGELDTISDLTTYFIRKERLVRNGQLVWANGEEDMVAYYMTRLNREGEHDFTLPDGASLTENDHITLAGGFYARMRQNPQYQAKKLADRNSYLWDKLINQFTTHMLAGTSVIFEGQTSLLSDLEEGVRHMALVPRYKRRLYGDSILDVLQGGQSTDRYMRAMLPGPTEPDRSTGFFFMTLAVANWSLDGGYEQYRKVRMAMLKAYALALHETNPNLEQVVGIATEPPDPRAESGSSEDLILMEKPNWTDELRADLDKKKRLFNIMEPGNFKERSLLGNEFPSPEEQKLLEIKETSRSLFRRDAASAGKETTPKVITSAIKSLALQLKADVDPCYVPVRNDAYGLYGYCSDGVLEKIKHDGGGICFGWTIWEWPGVLFTAEFHAVWIASGGELVDITPKPGKETKILFVSDDAYGADFDFDKRPLNRRMSAVEALHPQDYAAARIQQMKPKQLQYEEQRARKAGKTLEEWLAIKMPADQMFELVKELVAVCDEFDRLMDAAPKHSMGHVLADDKLVETIQRRAQLRDKVRTLR